MAAKVIKYRCSECLSSVAVTPMNKYRKHPPNSDDPCRMSGQQVPVRIIMAGADDGDDRPVKGRDYDECPGCSRMPKLDPDGAFKEHAESKGSETLCMFSGKLKSGKKPTPEIPGATQYVEKLQTAAEQTAPCPEPGCRRTPTIQADGTFIAHMGVDWGDKVCPMSGRVAQPIGAQAFSSAAPQESASPQEAPFPSQVELSTERPKASELPEIQALVQAFPKSARIPVSTPTAVAAPVPAVAPVTTSTPIHDAASEVLNGYRNAAAMIQEAANRAAQSDATIPTAAECTCGMAPDGAWAHDDNCPQKYVIRHQVSADSEPPIPIDRLKFVSCSCGKGHGESHPAGGDCILTLEELPRLCDNCGQSMGGYHECLDYRPMFVRPDPVPFEIDGSALPEFVPAGEIPAPLRPLDMSTEAEQLVARMKEIFYAYSNRMDRSVQETLGPSEIGTPCDRRLAMSLLRVAPVNPGGDNWASFVGTCVHAGLADMFVWADANQGRFAVEQKVEFPNALVPKGTADLLDRTLMMVDDHKIMGRWSLDKLRLEGIKPLYLVQLMVYAYGMILKGEKVEKVALIAWPREQGNLNDLTAVVLPYDKEIAENAFRRVDRIAAEVKDAQTRTSLAPLRIAKGFSVQDDCTYCPFFAKGDSEMTRGCNGRK